MYSREVQTKHGQTRWAVDVVIGGVKREMLFAHEAAAHDALVTAGMDRDEGVPPEQTLRVLRMLAWDTLNFEGELTDTEFERLKEIDALREKAATAEASPAAQMLWHVLFRFCSLSGLDWEQAKNLTFGELLDRGTPPPDSGEDGMDP